jgi:hypothetical protein
LDKTTVADQVGKFLSQIDLNLLGVVGFEVPVTRLMKMDEKGHDLTVIQFPLALALPSAAHQLLVLPVERYQLAEIIDMTEQFG